MNARACEHGSRLQPIRDHERARHGITQGTRRPEALRANGRRATDELHWQGDASQRAGHPVMEGPRAAEASTASSTAAPIREADNASIRMPDLRVSHHARSVRMDWDQRCTRKVPREDSPRDDVRSGGVQGVRGAAAVTACVVLVAGCGASGQRTSAQPKTSTDGVPLFPVAATLTATCQREAGHYHSLVLCPSVLPRASIGSRSLRRLRLTLYHGSPCGFAGVSFMYVGGPSLHRPSGFLHFELDRRSRCYFGDPGGRPPGSHWTRLGGRVGWLEPAGPAPDWYFGDHVRFYFRVDKTGWVATLHSFGRGTTPLLARLVKRVDIVEPDGAIKSLSG